MLKFWRFCGFRKKVAAASCELRGGAPSARREGDMARDRARDRARARAHAFTFLEETDAFRNPPRNHDRECLRSGARRGFRFPSLSLCQPRCKALCFLRLHVCLAPRSGLGGRVWRRSGRRARRVGCGCPERLDLLWLECIPACCSEFAMHTRGGRRDQIG